MALTMTERKLEAQRRNAQRPRRIRRLTEELIDQIAQAVRDGVRPETAALLNGVPRRTYYDWMERARAEDARPLLQHLLAEVEVALAQWEASDALLIGSAAREKNPGEWTAAAWRLERRLPSVYGRRTQQDVTVQARPFVDPGKLSLEEQRTLYELLQKAAPATEELPKDAAPALLALGAGEQPA